MTDEESFTAFQAHRGLAHGDLATVARALFGRLTGESVLIFNDANGQPVELDLRHGVDQAVAEYRTRHPSVETLTGPSDAPPRRGRPKLGVVAREVTLLPRHWDWLAAQPGGASAALRRLVEDARRVAAGPDRVRKAREILYRVMSPLAGDLPGFEDASRALFAGDDDGFETILDQWPADVAAFLRRLAQRHQG